MSRGVIPDRISFVLRAFLYSLLGKRGIKQLVRELFASHQVPESVLSSTTDLLRRFRTRVGILPIFSDEELQRLTMPTLVLGGTKDVLRDIEKIAARLYACVPQLEVVLLPGVGYALVNTLEHILPFVTP